MVTPSRDLVIGIVGLQGAYHLHEEVFHSLNREDCSISTRIVKTPEQLTGLDGIVIPGGESTVMEKLLVTSGLDEPLSALIENSFPVFGTCAGLILLANYFRVLDCTVERNAYGSQKDSFEAEVQFPPKSTTCHAYFIRAPKITKVGDDVEIIARVGDEIVGVIQNNNVGITCHPEVAGTSTFHDFFVDILVQRVTSELG